MSDNQSYGTTPPDPNQDKNEPGVGSSPETSAQARDPEVAGAASAGESSRASKEQGAPPREMETDDGRGAAEMRRSASPPNDGGVPVPGDPQGVAVPSVQAAAGTSEQSEAVDGVKTTAIAPPGKPDGEVDTRPESRTGRGL